MGQFRSFLTEAPSSDVFHAEVLLHHSEAPIVRLIKRSQLHEKQYPEREQEHIEGGHGYKVLGEFKPTSLDHDTITKEFHEHLHKHGYYAYTNSHPLVMSPKEQKFKKEFKDRAFEGKVPKYERPHHDGGFGGKGTGHMGRFTALWSTSGGTHVFQHEKEGNARHVDATKDMHTTVINDQKVRHAASGHLDRWFIRQGEIKKIPKQGLMLPGKNKGDKPRIFGHDVHAYIAAKQKSVGGPRREVQEWNLRQQKIGKAGLEHHASVMDWVKKNHPEYHPDT